MSESEMWEQVEKVVNEKGGEIDYAAYLNWYYPSLEERCQISSNNGAQSTPMTRIQEPPALPPLVVVALVVFVGYLLVLLAGAQ